jgi:AcrR family transcriptional regulator
MAQQERAIRTRQAILAAAAAVFDEVGYEAAAVAEILRRAGVSKGAMYFHFGSKQELAQGVLEAQIEALSPVPAQELKLQESLDEALLMAYMLQKDTGDPIVRGSVRLTVDQGSPKDGLDRHLPMQRWVDHTRDVLTQSKARGEILPHVDLDCVARLLVGAFTGVQVLSNIMTERVDMPQRVADLYRHLMPSVVVPSVLLGMDFDPARGERLFNQARKQ